MTSEIDIDRPNDDEIALPPCGDDGRRAGRDSRGRFAAGNLARLESGQHSTAFWRAHDETRRAIETAVIADAGHTPDDAPKALAIAASNISQSMVVRDSAYARICDAGGPLTAGGRVRRAVAVWASAVDRLERHLRLVGLTRAPRPTQTLADYLKSKSQENS